MNKTCGACGAHACRQSCDQAFATNGIAKVHWECWAKCNLHCKFCYRTKDEALSFNDAEKLLRIVATSGAQWITFAGGDPSVRPDIVALIRSARSLGLKIEVQTNADSISPQFRDEILTVDQVGLSLDGPTPEVHDVFRDRPGNYLRVMALLSDLAAAHVPTLIRTVVALSNQDAVPAIAHVLSPYSNVRRWSILEFSPLGDGYVNREKYELPPDTFRNIVGRAKREGGSHLNVDGFGNDAKAGTYALVSPGGRLYGTEYVDDHLGHRFVGNMLTDHLSDLVEALPFNSQRHHARYGDA
ncbi:radical SAM protein [Anatilimnocola sp. NA78]|uniref:radical SAM protein n=1 Tax=Anatilimnocola sp. NA78 TaxID=3415683 RepID=UPI003CE570DA